MAYSFVAPLTTYTEQQRLPLITKAVFSARSAALFTKQVGIKSSAALNLMDTDANIQSGTVCGWSATGNTTFTQRNITVGAMKIQEALCPRSLEQYWMQSQLTAGSTYDGVPFEQAFAGTLTQLNTTLLDSYIAPCLSGMITPILLDLVHQKILERWRVHPQQ